MRSVLRYGRSVHRAERIYPRDREEIGTRTIRSVVRTDLISSRAHLEETFPERISPPASPAPSPKAPSTVAPLPGTRGDHVTTASKSAALPSTRRSRRARSPPPAARIIPPRNKTPAHATHARQLDGTVGSTIRNIESAKFIYEYK